MNKTFISTEYTELLHDVHIQMAKVFNRDQLQLSWHIFKLNISLSPSSKISQELPDSEYPTIFLKKSTG